MDFFISIYNIHFITYLKKNNDTLTINSTTLFPHVHEHSQEFKSIKN